MVVDLFEYLNIFVMRLCNKTTKIMFKRESKVGDI